MKISRPLVGGLSLSTLARGAAISNRASNADKSVLESRASPIHVSDMLQAAQALQSVYYNHGAGLWPGVNDWISAVLGTQLAATLKTISKREPLPADQEHHREDLINTYFADLLQSYPAQDILGIYMQANDDMLWVTLEWLEASTFVQQHTALRHKNEKTPWFGNSYLQPFSHRARTFWEAASLGWSEDECGGGMTWDNKKLTYKNAITNQLWVAASSSMYLYFTGDNDDTPLGAENHKYSLEEELERAGKGNDDLYKPHDKKYLDAAVKGYNWLMGSGMTNGQGLFIDGFHVTPATKQCDQRGEQIWTYNQGVILTGQRNLWQATGQESYLNDGHDLIKTVIRATGWDLAVSKPTSDPSWQGIGRLGVLEESCDKTSSCNPDQKTFKGIYMMHFNKFCQPLPQDGSEFGHKASAGLAAKHAEQCAQYAPWIEHNAKAAMTTRDGSGLFGGWWNENLLSGASKRDELTAETTFDQLFGLSDENMKGALPGIRDESITDGADSIVDGFENAFGGLAVRKLEEMAGSPRAAESQSGGLSVLRAAVELSSR